VSRFIATFHSHFGALSFYKALKELDIAAELLPVPRKLSSSCGTCVCYEHGSPVALSESELNECELDGIFFEAGGALECVFRRNDD